MKTALKILQWYRPRDRWVLKCPQHLEQIGPLMEAFPDATIVNADDGAGGVYMFAGCGSSAWPNWIGALDNLTISAGGDTTIFDFEGEPNPIPALSELGLFAFVLMLVAVAIAAMKIRL